MNVRDGEASEDERADIVDLIFRLEAGERLAASEELARLRGYFSRRVLPGRPNRRVFDKHAQHAKDDVQWPDDTSPEEYLQSLRATVTDPRCGIYLTRAEVEETWTIYFVGPVRRAWRGRYAGGRIGVLFSAERPFWITGFQPEEGDMYVERQGGLWVRQPS